MRVLISLALSICGCAALADGLLPEMTGRGQSVSLMAGRMTWDDYGTLAYAPQDIDWAPSRFVAGIYGRHWALTARPRVRLGYEAAVLIHDGVNDHIELTLPAVIRYRALDPVVPWQGAAFGLGVSIASTPPELEIARKGQSQRAIPHWFMELEFGKPDWAVAPFLRIHHRSDGFIFADFDTGSNGVGLGLRWQF